MTMTATRGRRATNRPSLRMLLDRYTFALMVIPAAALFLFFHTWPLISGIWQSFTNNRGYGDYSFVGLQNYQALIGDSRVVAAYVFTILVAIVSTVLVNAIAFMLALALNARIKAKGALRAVYFLPYILPMLVVGYVFRFLFSSVFPGLVDSLGGTGTNILTDPNWAWVGVVIVTVWRAVAFNVIIYIAGLQTIDPDVYEAASLDGAGRVKSALHITLPLTFGFVIINVVLNLKDFLQIFDQVMALTAGGPGTSTETVAMVIYKGGFSGGEYAYQMANAVVYFIVILVVSVLQLKVLSRRGEDQ